MTIQKMLIDAPGYDYDYEEKPKEQKVSSSLLEWMNSRKFQQLKK